MGFRYASEGGMEAACPTHRPEYLCQPHKNAKNIPLRPNPPLITHTHAHATTPTHAHSHKYAHAHTCCGRRLSIEPVGAGQEFRLETGLFQLKVLTHLGRRAGGRTGGRVGRWAGVGLCAARVHAGSGADWRAERAQHGAEAPGAVVSVGSKESTKTAAGAGQGIAAIPLHGRRIPCDGCRCKTPFLSPRPTHFIPHRA
jgi:hypothetical protein